MSESEVPSPAVSTATTYLKLIQHHVREAERELEKGEHLRVVVCTPEGRLEASQLEGEDPNLLVVHGFRGGRRVTLVSALETTQISIERIPLTPEAKSRYLGFRIPD